MRKRLGRVGTVVIFGGAIVWAGLWLWAQLHRGADVDTKMHVLRTDVDTLELRINQVADSRAKAAVDSIRVGQTSIRDSIIAFMKADRETQDSVLSILKRWRLR